MTARERIETLTNSWYGFAVVSSFISLLMNGFGLFRLFFTGVSLVFSVAITYWLGKRLLNRSSLTRTLLIIVSVVGTILGAVWTVRQGGSLLGSFSFSTLLQLVLTGMGVVMHIRSFRTLTDSSVKTYFG
jgi:hypothetical protein